MLEIVPDILYLLFDELLLFPFDCKLLISVVSISQIVKGFDYLLTY